MKTRHIPFFATQGDLAPIAQEIGSKRPIDFVLAGLFTEPSLTVFQDFGSLRPLENYVIIDRGARVEIRAVPQRAGGVRYAVDQLANSTTLGLQLGGLINEQHLLASQIGTVSEHQVSIELFMLFAKAIRKNFEKIQSYYVGPQAVLMLDRGARLSSTTKSPPPYDLARQAMS
jgi:hypothetical protein